MGLLNVLVGLFGLATLAFSYPSSQISQTHPILLKGGTIITFVETNSTLVPIVGDLLLSNGIIQNISSSPITPPEYTEIIDARGTIITPGFVDAHRHGWQTMYRTLGANITLAAYYWSHGEFGVGPIYFTPEDVYVSQLAGMYEAINAGVTTIVDHAHHTWSWETAEAGLRASIDSGARSWWCYTIHPVPDAINPFSVDYNTTSWMMNQIDDMLSRGPLADGRVNVGLAYDALVLPEATVLPILEFAVARNLVYTTHYLGESFIPGLHSIQVLYDYGILNQSIPMIFSHASPITDAEIGLLRQYNKHIAICAESELHYSHGHPKSYLIQDQAALGIDTHYTFSTDIITQMRINLQTTRLTLAFPIITEGFMPNNTGMTVDQGFLMGTRNGGLALNRSDIGVIKVGAKADIVVFDMNDKIGLWGWRDPVAAVVLHSNVGDIRDVIIDGVIRKRNYKLIGVDLEKLQADFLSRAERIQYDVMRANYTDFRTGVEKNLAGWTNANFLPVNITDVVRGNGTGFFGHGPY